MPEIAGTLEASSRRHDILRVRIVRIKAQALVRIRARGRQFALLVMKRGARQPSLDVQGRFGNFAVQIFKSLVGLIHLHQDRGNTLRP